MRKREELSDPKSCMNRAKDEEMTFVLLARDESSSGAIRWWIADRIRRGKNKPNDPQILEAEQCAKEMEAKTVKTSSVLIVTAPGMTIRQVDSTDDEIQKMIDADQGHTLSDEEVESAAKAIADFAKQEPNPRAQ